MSELEIFNNEEFGQVRSVEVEGEPYFVAKDIAIALGYSNPRKAIIDHVDEEDKGKYTIYTNGGYQCLNCININGVISLISKSNLLTFEQKRKFLISLGIPDDKIVCNTRKEISFIDDLIIVLNELGITIFNKQYRYCDYKIDLYLPQLNVAIEYDENEHRNYSYENQLGRQYFIEEKLKCRFIRVSDNYSNLENIGKVIKIIEKLKENRLKNE